MSFQRHMEFLFGRNDITVVHDFTWFRLPVPVASMDIQLKKGLYPCIAHQTHRWCHSSGTWSFSWMVSVWPEWHQWYCMILVTGAGHQYGQPTQKGLYSCIAHQTPCSLNLLCASLPAFTCPVLFDARHCVICQCCYQSWKHTIDSVSRVYWSYSPCCKPISLLYWANKHIIITAYITTHIIA